MGELGLRLVIPLTDNYDYYHGGYWNYVSFEGGGCEWRPKHVPPPGDDCRSFFDHAEPRGPAVIAHFKEYVRVLLTHVNQFTNIALKDETAVLAWETGNELQTESQPFAAWTEEIAVFIKEELGARQLVLDGRDEGGMGVDIDALHKTSHVDMYTDHFYESAVTAAAKVGNNSAFAVGADEVYYVGEYGPSDFSPSDLQLFLSTLENSHAVGDTWWSFFPHGDNYGFVSHGDAYTVHYPGKDNASQSTLLALRSHAFSMRGLAVPEDTDMPGQPLITQASVKQLVWRGATLAVRYDVEVAQAPEGPFTKICDKCASDHDVPWDVPAQFQSYSYIRVRGYSLKGTPGRYSAAASPKPSNESWPHMTTVVDSTLGKVGRSRHAVLV